MKSTRKFSKVLSLALALVLALALFPTAVFAADPVMATVAVTGPEDVDLSTGDPAPDVNAYELLAPVEGNENVYEETDTWKTFFSNVHGLTADTYYMSYDADANKLVFSTTEPQTGECVAITLDSDLDKNYPVNDLFDRLNTGAAFDNTDALTAIGTWARSNATDNGFRVDETSKFSAPSGTPEVSRATLTLKRDSFYLLATENLPLDVVSLRSIMQVAGDGTTAIALKAKPYELEKEAGTPTSTQVGTVVPYEITMPLPESSTTKTIHDATLTDTLTGADFDQDSFVLTIGQNMYYKNPTGGQFPLSDVAELTFSGDKDRTFTLNFTAAGYAALNDLADGVTNASVTLAYDVVVAKDAEYVVNNTATINMGHGPDQIVDTVTNTEHLYGVQLQKAFSDGSTDYSAVRFELYDENGTNEIPLTRVSEGVYAVKGLTDTQSTPIQPDSTGKLTIKGLAAGTYKLVETQTKPGFNEANATITLNADPDNPGQLLNTSTVTIDNNAQANATVKNDGANTNVLVTFDFLNQKGFALPSTGGAGTWMFTLGGLALIAIAGTALYVSKKKVTE